MKDFALEVYFSKWEFAAKYNSNAIRRSGYPKQSMSMSVRYP
jgi:hypothetical protein